MKIYYFSINSIYKYDGQLDFCVVADNLLVAKGLLAVEIDKEIPLLGDIVFGDEIWYVELGNYVGEETEPFLVDSEHLKRLNK